GGQVVRHRQVVAVVDLVEDASPFPAAVVGEAIVHLVLRQVVTVGDAIVAAVVGRKAMLHRHHRIVVELGLLNGGCTGQQRLWQPQHAQPHTGVEDDAVGGGRADV